MLSARNNRLQNMYEIEHQLWEVKVDAAAYANDHHAEVQALINRARQFQANDNASPCQMHALERYQAALEAYQRSCWRDSWAELGWMLLSAVGYKRPSRKPAEALCQLHHDLNGVPTSSEFVSVTYRSGWL